MTILFQLGHPAHFHLFRPTIGELQGRGHNVVVAIKSKDVLEPLLQSASMPYVNLLPSGSRSRAALVGRVLRLARLCRAQHVDVLAGSTPDVAIVGRLLGKRSVVFFEDDADVVPRFVRAVRPFADCCLAPTACNAGPLEPRTTHYEGYQKLAYLHPARFTPSTEVVDRYLPHAEPYFLLRFAELKAYHDVQANAHGISNSVASHLVQMLAPHGRVCISSERPLPPQLEPLRLRIDPLDMHHIMAFASMYIGDSQSMAVEAAVLGVPSVRFNSFAGRIGVLNELEQRYGLTLGIPAADPQRLYAEVGAMLNHPSLWADHQARKARMLREKTDVSAFFTDFILNLAPSHS